MNLSPETRSLWLDTSDAPARPALSADIAVDVAVVGAGITGITTALLLKRGGATVAVLEAGRVCDGITGYTTAKVSSLHGLVYQDLVSTFGEDGACIYAQANEGGLDLIAQLVQELGIECDFRRKPNYTYAASPDELRDVEQEAEAARRAGLPVTFTDRLDLPYAIIGSGRPCRTGRVPPTQVRAGARRADPR